MSMQLEELKVYQLSMDIAEDIWDIVVGWNYFEKDTVGKQLVKAVDSIAANLSEGFGRYHYKEAKHFSYYSRGSLYETKTWLTKAFNRKLIDKDEFEKLRNEIKNISVKLNNYIKSVGRTTGDQIREDNSDFINY
jgi:four helix bundle protein